MRARVLLLLSCCAVFVGLFLFIQGLTLGVAGLSIGGFLAVLIGALGVLRPNRG